MVHDGDARPASPHAAGPLTEAELRTQLARYAALVEHAPDAIVILDVASGRFVLVNGAAEELFGLPRDRLFGVGPAEVSPRFQPDGRSSETAAREYVARAVAGERPRFDWTHCRADGSPVDCEISLLRLPSAEGPLVRGSILDVSERRDAEHARQVALAAQSARRAAEATAARLQAFVAGLNAVVWERDGVHGQVRFINDRVEDLLGYPVQQWLADPGLWLRLVHPDDRADAVGALTDGIAADDDVTLTYRMTAADGRVLCVRDLLHVVRDESGGTHLHGVLIDITDQTRREQSSALLAEAGRILSSPGSLEERLGSVAGVAVGHLGDWAGVWLRGDDDRYRPVAAAPADAVRRVRAVPPLRVPAAFRAVFAAGRPFVVPEVPEGVDRAATTDDNGFAAMRALGSSGGIAAPLVSGGELVGLLTLAASEPGRRYDDLDLTLAGELGQRIADTVAAERVAARERQVHEISVALSAAASVGEAAAELTAGLRRVLDAQVVSVCRVSDDGLLHTVDVVGYPSERMEPFAAMRLTAPFPLTDAARTGQPVWLPDRAAWEARYPDIAPSLQATTDAGAALPMTVGDRVVGAVGISFDRPRSFPAAERAFLQTLTGQVAMAFERAAIADVRREMADTLQRSLLPAQLPALDRLAVTASYLPAVQGTSAGGDWYDILPLEGGRVALAVGDVVGNGAPAAAVMGQLRSALAALLLEGHGPARALELLERFAGHVSGARVTTVACLLLDPATGEFTVSRAGHPPLLVADAAGVRYLEDGLGPALGVLPGVRRPEARAQLAPGSVLVVYTDGLVERRGTILDEGLARLADATASRRTQPLPELVGGVLAELLDRDGAPDDIALVAARLLPAPLSLDLPADPALLQGLRRAVQSWAAGVGLAADTTEDLQLALGEAVANAVEHAYQGVSRVGRVSVTVLPQDDGGLAVRVEDRGLWRPVPADPGFRGRGLQMMRALGEDVVVDAGPEGTTVRFRLGARPAQRPVPAGVAVPVAPEQLAELLTSQRGGRQWLELVGDLDLAGVPAVRPALLAGLAVGGPVTLDLRRVGHLASVGLGLLLEAVRSRAAGDDVELLMPDCGPARRALDLAGLTPAAEAETPDPEA